MLLVFRVVKSHLLAVRQLNFIFFKCTFRSQSMVIAKGKKATVSLALALLKKQESIGTTLNIEFLSNITTRNGRSILRYVFFCYISLSILHNMPNSIWYSQCTQFKIQNVASFTLFIAWLKMKGSCYKCSLLKLNSPEFISVLSQYAKRVLLSNTTQYISILWFYHNNIYYHDSITAYKRVHQWWLCFLCIQE